MEPTWLQVTLGKGLTLWSQHPPGNLDSSHQMHWEQGEGRSGSRTRACRPHAQETQGKVRHCHSVSVTAPSNSAAFLPHIPAAFWQLHNLSSGSPLTLPVHAHSFFLSTATERHDEMWSVCVFEREKGGVWSHCLSKQVPHASSVLGALSINQPPQICEWSITVAIAGRPGFAGYPLTSLPTPSFPHTALHWPDQRAQWLCQLLPLPPVSC
jgi:hypothetical protein